MATIIVQVGQCGNQLGAALWRLLDCEDSSSLPWKGVPQPSSNVTGSSGCTPRTRHGPVFAHDGFARCVLIDAEPKVVSAAVARFPKLFRSGNAICGNSGRGNNWLQGYFEGSNLSCRMNTSDNEEGSKSRSRQRERPSSIGHVKHDQPFDLSFAARDQREADATLLQKSMSVIRREIKRGIAEEGSVEAIVVIQSLAGGTGSGFGSAILDNIQYHYCRSRLNTEVEDEAKNVDESAQQQSKRKAQGPILSPVVITVPEGERIYGGERNVALCRRLISMCVLPRRTGETAVQSLNATLALSVVLRTCDAVLMLRNDRPWATSAGAVAAGLRESQAGSQMKSFFCNDDPFYAVNTELAGMIASILQGGRVYGAISSLVTRLMCRFSPGCCRFLTLFPACDIGRLRQLVTTGDQHKNQEHSFMNVDTATRLPPHMAPYLGTSIAVALFSTSPMSPLPTLRCLMRNDSSTASARQHAYMSRKAHNPHFGAGSGSHHNQTPNALPSQKLQSFLFKSCDNKTPDDNESDDEPDDVLHVKLLPTAQTMVPTLVLNQGCELSQRLLLPLLLDTATKIETGAYLHTLTQGVVTASQLSQLLEYMKYSCVYRTFTPVESPFASPFSQRKPEERHHSDDCISLIKCVLRQAVRETAAALAMYPGSMS